MGSSDYRTRLTRYAAGVASGFVITAGLWLILVAFQTGAPTLTTQWTYDIIRFKSRAAGREHEPKLLLVGGSSTLFGMNAKQISSTTGMPTINFGVHGGLGIPYLLYTARNLVRPGDTVLLCFEYGSYSDGVSDFLVDYLYARDPAYLGVLPTYVRWKMPLYLSASRILTGLSSRNRPPDSPPPPTWGCYTKESLDEFGDETCNVDAHKTTDMAARFRQQLQSPPEFPAGTTEAFLAIRKFRIWAHDQGVRVLATYPSTLRRRDFDSGPWLELFRDLAAFYHDIDVPLLGSPQTFMYDDTSLFFDTPHHLTDRGARLRTEELIVLLSPYLQRRPAQ